MNAAPALRPIIAQAVTGKTGPAAFAEFEKMMKSGQVTAAKFMPIVAKAVAEQARKGGALEGAEADLNSQIERLANAKRDLVEALDKAGTGEALAKVVQSLAKGLQDAAKWVDVNKDKVQQVFSLFKQVGDLLYDIATNKTVQIAAGLTIVSGIVLKILESLTPMRLVCLLIASAISDWVPELKTSEDGTIAFGKALDAVQVKLVDIKRDLVEMAPLIGAVVGAYMGFQVGGAKGAAIGAALGLTAGTGFRTYEGMAKESTMTGKLDQFINTGSTQENGWKTWRHFNPIMGTAATIHDMYQTVKGEAGPTTFAAALPVVQIARLVGNAISETMGFNKPNSPNFTLPSQPAIGSQSNTINIYPPAGSSPEDIGKKVYAELNKQAKESANQATKGPR